MGESTSPSSYKSTLTSLLPPSRAHVPLYLPVSPAKPHIPADSISSLRLHPVLEAGLHLLNRDLPSAHFLLRHMQAKPAWEAMYLHGILHRIEGDIENARAWYEDVKDEEVFEFVWRRRTTEDEDELGDVDDEDETSNDYSTSPYESSRTFLSQVESYKNSILSSSVSTTNTTTTNNVDNIDSIKDIITQKSLGEFQRFMTFCEGKFGTSPVSDASSIWVSMSDKNKEQAANMITGGEGWREF
ncbi:hypothetical protein H2204_010009 [Knufia peltigerae]|uniref:Uncharacterized protein n=1 Tax=Knufia peltigerae TaxID=1002370 RepID=A0AA39CVB6_9EURO|nr:hypothetical protein H2204_010009 [Knufia peltigerae]